MVEYETYAELEGEYDIDYAQESLRTKLRDIWTILRGKYLTKYVYLEGDAMVEIEPMEI